MVRVKICGITRAMDAQAAALAGADALGFVFYPPSPRAVCVEQLSELVADLPPFVSRVALFVNPTEAAVCSVLRTGEVDVLQFHGDESPEFCRGFGYPYIKAIRMKPDICLDKEMQDFSSARGILLDHYDPYVYGGTGRSFDWSRVKQTLGKVILAGGLTPETVTEAVATVNPCAVDVSGGVESARGIKDHERVRSFIQRAKYGQQGISRHP